MRFDLKEPCKNCPFRTDETRITFRCRERAEEIEEHAYRNGFPCHVSAECRKDPITGEEGFEFGENTQHCAGYLLMQLRDGMGSPWPGIGNDEELADRLTAQLDPTAPVFESAEEFSEANTEKPTDAEAEHEQDAEGTEARRDGGAMDGRRLADRQ